MCILKEALASVRCFDTTTAAQRFQTIYIATLEQRPEQLSWKENQSQKCQNKKGCPVGTLGIHTSSKINNCRHTPDIRRGDV